MREILFRGKRLDNGKWVQGFLVIWRNDYYIAPDINAYTSMGGRGKGRCMMFGHYYQVLPETVGQYTGLTDKNGKKIFEGDILKIIHKYQSPFDDDTKEYTDITTDVVFFDDEGLCFSYGKSPFLCVVDNVTAEYEVVGNIHDNPELLEVTE